MKFLNYWFAKLWIRLLGTLSGTSVRTRAKLAVPLAWLMWQLIPKRRHITLTNLRLCFPDKTEQERVQLAKKVYVRLARAALDHSVLWYGTREQVQALVRYENLEYVTDESYRPIIAVAPHFAGLDAAGIAFNTHVRGVSIYQPQRNKAWDEAALKGRLRFCEPLLIPKSQHANLMAGIRAIKKGMPFYYLPDMDYGRDNAIFVPFFGVPAATLPMVSRLARVTKSIAVWCIAEMTDDGYVVHLKKIENFPTKDYVADTIRLNQELEKWILQFPDQYLWTHRRFKTRPEGEPSVY